MLRAAPTPSGYPDGVFYYFPKQKKMEARGLPSFLLCSLRLFGLFLSRHPLDGEQDDKDCRPD